MELILKETISTLGREGEVVKVKAGYGRNYLLPQGKAVLATTNNMAVLEKNRAIIAARLTKEQKIQCKRYCKTDKRASVCSSRLP